MYASYLLKEAGDGFTLGRKAIATRRLTRFLFYYIVIELLRDILIRMGLSGDNKQVTKAIVALNGSEDGRSAWKELLDAAIEVIDSYLTNGTDNCVFDEPVLRNTYNNDLGTFLRWEQLTKAKDKTPMLSQLLEVTKMSLRKPPRPGQASTREQLQKALGTAQL